VDDSAFSSVSKRVVFETDNVYVHDLSFESSIMFAEWHNLPCALGG
jgi:hypothetical protein